MKREAAVRTPGGHDCRTERECVCMCDALAGTS